MNPLAWLNPGRWLLYIALGAALVLGLRVWEERIEARGDAAGYARARAEYEAAALAASEEARRRESELRAQYDKAVRDANEREKTLAAAAASARRERDGLRDDLAAARDAIARASADSVRLYAATVGELLDECVAEYLAMARTADGHASDARALIEAWPKNSPEP